MNKTLKIILILVGVGVVCGIGLLVGVIIYLNNRVDSKVRIDANEYLSYYLVSKNGKYGVRSLNDEELIPIKYDTIYAEQADDLHEYSIFICEDGNYSAVYNKDGRCRVPIEKGYYTFCPIGFHLNKENTDKRYIVAVKKYENGNTTFGLLYDYYNDPIIPCTIQGWPDNFYFTTYDGAPSCIQLDSDCFEENGSEYDFKRYGAFGYWENYRYIEDTDGWHFDGWRHVLNEKDIVDEIFCYIYFPKSR